MTYLFRLLIIVGSLVGAWRILVRLQKRPPNPSPQSLIQHTDATERVLGFTSIGNLRDIGGYRTQDGKLVRRNRLYRSAALAYISDKEAEKFEKLGIKLVCDLRSPEEISVAPDKVPHGADYWQISMLQLNNPWSEVSKMLFVPHYMTMLTAQIYKQLLTQQTQNFADIFRRLADGNSLPTLVHCTAGKDRTGVTVALLLLFLGVSEKDVLADYSQTNHFYDYIHSVSADLIKRLGRIGLRQEDVIPLLLADPQNLKTALDDLMNTYGSIENYFLRGLKLEPDVLERLREAFLE